MVMDGAREVVLLVVFRKYRRASGPVPWVPGALANVCSLPTEV